MIELNKIYIMDWTQRSTTCVQLIYTTTTTAAAAVNHTFYAVLVTNDNKNGR